MSKPKLIIIGAGGHAMSCIDVIEQNNQYQIVGLVGLQEEYGKDLLGYKVFATNDELSKLAKTYENAIVAIGQLKSADLRVKLFEMVKNNGFKMPKIISPHAYVARSARVEDGTIIMHGVIINAAAEIGKNCIINSNVLVEHGASVGNHCHISTGAIINGDVIIGDHCFIGSKSTIKQGISIGNKCIIEMGLAIRNDIPDSTYVNADQKV